MNLIINFGRRTCCLMCDRSHHIHETVGVIPHTSRSDNSVCACVLHDCATNELAYLFKLHACIIIIMRMCMP